MYRHLIFCKYLHKHNPIQLLGLAPYLHQWAKTRASMDFTGSNLMDLLTKLKTVKRSEKKLPHYFGRVIHAIDLLAFGRNEGSGLKVPDIRELKFLCFDGDLKHVFRTVNENLNFTEIFSFTLVDSNPHIQARNMVLIYILLKTKNTEIAVDAFIKVMYSLHLDDDMAFLVDTALEHLLDVGLDILDGVCVSGEEVSQIMDIWKAWQSAGCHMTVRMEKLRQAKAEMSHIVEYNNNYLDSIPKETRKAVQRWIDLGDFGGKEDLELDQPNITLTCLNPLFVGKQVGMGEFEVESEIAVGILALDPLVHAPHAIDSPYQDWDFVDVANNYDDDDIEEAYIKYIKNQAKIVRDVYKEGKLKISLILAPLVLVSKFIPNYSFDRIITGKAADVHGTATILAICEPLLSIGNMCASVITHHRIWRILVDEPDPRKAFSQFLRAEYLLGLEQAGHKTSQSINSSDAICISGLTLHSNTIIDVSIEPTFRKVSNVDTTLRNLEWIRLRNKEVFNPMQCFPPISQSIVNSDDNSADNLTEDPRTPVKKKISKNVGRALRRFSCYDAPLPYQSPTPEVIPVRAVHNRQNNDTNPTVVRRIRKKLPGIRNMDESVEREIRRYSHPSPPLKHKQVDTCRKTKAGIGPKPFKVNSIETKRPDTPIPSPDLSINRHLMKGHKGSLPQMATSLKRGTNVTIDKRPVIVTEMFDNISKEEKNREGDIEKEGKFLFLQKFMKEEWSQTENDYCPEILETLKMPTRRSSLSMPRKEKKFRKGEKKKRTHKVTFDETPVIISECSDYENK